MTSGPTSVAQNILEPVLPVWPRQSICQVCSWLCWQVLVWAMSWWGSRYKGWERRKNKGWDLNEPRHPTLHQDSQTVRPLVFLFFFLDLFIYSTLQYCIGFAIHQHDPPQMYMCSPSWNPLPPPSPYHPSGSSQCTSPKHPVSWIEPSLQFVSYMILYMFQCHSPKSSHPLPHRVQKTVLYICVSSAISHTGLLLPCF